MATVKTPKKKVVKPAVKKTPTKKAVKKVVAVKKKVTPLKGKAVTKKQPAKKIKKAAVKKPSAKKTIAPKVPAKKTAAVKTHSIKKVTIKKKTMKITTDKKNNLSRTTHLNQSNKQPLKEDTMITTTMDDMDIAMVPYEIEKGADYMTEEQLEHFRKILLRWKHQLMQEVDSTVGHMQEDGLSYPDPIDRASQEEGFNLELRTRDRERKLIKKIESSIDSIESGEYGYCADCGAEIGVRRLEARPTADKCIDCKTYEEIREKQSGGL